MKKGLALIVALICCAWITPDLSAQKAKFGHIDYAATIQLMPGIDTLQTAILAFKTELEKEAAIMQEEFDTKYKEFAEKQGTYSASVAQVKQRELESLYERMQTFASTAEEELQTRQIEMLQPFQEKLLEAIKVVAKEQHYTYIFDKTSVLYFTDSEDITSAVKKKLGITK